MARMTSFRHDEPARAVARLAYRTLEPYHLAAYFGPHVDATREELGIGWLGAYTGMRAAPLGPVPGEVVAATVLRLPAGGGRPRPGAWPSPGTTPAELDEVRTRCLDAGLRAALGDLAESPALVDLVARLRPVLEPASTTAGRPLAAAFAAQPGRTSPTSPSGTPPPSGGSGAATATSRPSTAAGLRPLEALVLYDAGLRATSPAATAGSRGRPFLQPTRKWTDEEWAQATDGLVRRPAC